MSVRHPHALLEAYLDNDLSDSERREVEHLLDTSPDYRQEYQELVRLKEMLRNVSVPDPGPEYWSETTDVILARTVDHPTQDLIRVTVQPSQADRRSAFVRSLVSAVLSLAVLLSAIAIGSQHQSQSAATTGVISQSPILVTAPLRHMLHESASELYTPKDELRLARGMLLIGLPGFAGKLSGLAEYNHVLSQ